jgi:hypothetical protein
MLLSNGFLSLWACCDTTSCLRAEVCTFCSQISYLSVHEISFCACMMMQSPFFLKSSPQPIVILSGHEGPASRNAGDNDRSSSRSTSAIIRRAPRCSSPTTRFFSSPVSVSPAVEVATSDRQPLLLCGCSSISKDLLRDTIELSTSCNRSGRSCLKLDASGNGAHEVNGDACGAGAD